MALSEVTTTGNLHDYFGGDFDVRRAKVWATTNASDNTIHDESTGESRIGGGSNPPTIAADGTVTWTHWAPGVDANPASWQTTYHVDVPDRNAPGGRVRASYGPFTVTTSGLLTALVEEQAVPATYLSTVTTLLDTYVTEAEAARDAAELAEANAAAIAGADTADDLITVLDANAASDFRAQQDARHAAAYAPKASSLTRPEQPLRPLREQLDLGVSAQVQVLGDSTGNEVGEWPYQMGVSLAAEYPAYTVNHYLWSDGTQAYATPTAIQTGAGLERAIDFGTQGAWLPAAAIAPSGEDLDVRVKVTFDAWPLAGNGVLACRGYTAGNYSFRFLATTAQTVLVRFSIDGTTNVFSSTFTPTGIVAGTPTWLRFTYDGTDGANKSVRAYQSTDGATWTLLGTSTHGGTGTLHASTQDWELGSEGFTGSVLNGKIHQVKILDGIDGRQLSPLLMDTWRLRATTTASRVGAPVLAIVNGSHPGAAVTYFSDATRAPKMILPGNPAVVLMSISHNDGQATGWTYLAEWDTLLTRVRAYAKDASTPVVVTQNPQLSPGPCIDAHAVRRTHLAGWALKNGVNLIDVFAEFQDDPRGLAALLNVDGVHPLYPAGTELWRDTMLAGTGY